MFSLWLVCIYSAFAAQSAHFYARPPYLQNLDDGLNSWMYQDSAVVSTRHVTLTSLEKGITGSIWTRDSCSLDEWEANFQISVGEGQKGGANGFAFWYTATASSIGPLFGATDKWTGLGVFFNTHLKSKKSSIPFISAILNDGTKTFDYANDGKPQMIDGSFSKFRVPNVETSKPLYVRIVYVHSVLHVLVSSPLNGRRHEADGSGLKEFFGVNPDGTFQQGTPEQNSRQSERLSRVATNGTTNWELHTVLLAPGVKLPRGYFFGFSASTGKDISDKHVIQALDIGPVQHGIPLTNRIRQWAQSGQTSASNLPPPKQEPETTLADNLNLTAEERKIANALQSKIIDLTHDVYVQHSNLDAVQRQLQNAEQLAAARSDKKPPTQKKGAETGITVQQFQNVTRNLETQIAKQEKELLDATKKELNAVLRSAFSKSTFDKQWETHMKNISSNLEQIFPLALVTNNSAIKSDSSTFKSSAAILLNQALVEAVVDNVTRIISDDLQSMTSQLSDFLQNKLSRFEDKLWNSVSASLKRMEAEAKTTTQEIVTDTKALHKTIVSSEKKTISKMRNDRVLIICILAVLPIFFLLYLASSRVRNAV